jgi:hypothetical protein
VEFLARLQQALYQRLQVELQVIPAMIRLEAEVEVEAVDVGDHAVHRASAFALEKGDGRLDIPGQGE